MSKLYQILDASMCLCWCLTYVFVLIGTLKYKYPLISPITSAVVAPFEFVVLIFLIMERAIGFNHVFIAYFIWSFVELAIICIMVSKKYVRHRPLYIIAVVIVTFVMFFFVVIARKMFFFSYLNTLIGELFWLRFCLKKKDFPMKAITLIAFLLKMVADLISVPVYCLYGTFFETAMCLLLPVVDSLFIILWFVRRKKCVGNNKFIVADVS